MYNFGLYHWRRRFKTVLHGVVVLCIGGILFRRNSRQYRYLIAVAVVAIGSTQVARTLSKLCSPPPWTIERYKYDALGRALQPDEARRVVDIGCGTGRSLVGLAPHLPQSATILGLDVFDDRVILGNGPRLARRNGQKAGIDVSPISGDAGRLPLGADTVDVVTACRVLHDLSVENHSEALREFHRVITPDGHLGILELPITPAATTKPAEEYWRDQITDAGFALETVDRIERRNSGDPYIVVVATPV